MGKINEKDIQKMMVALEISREEAIEMLQFDNEEVENEEVKTIETKVADTQKANKPAKKKGSSLDKVKHQRAKKKADAVKEEIMGIIKYLVNGSTCIFNNPQDMTSSKITFTAKDGSYYSISVTKHKDKPDGYADQE